MQINPAAAFDRNRVFASRVPENIGAPLAAIIDITVISQADRRGVTIRAMTEVVANCASQHYRRNGVVLHININGAILQSIF